MLAVIDTNILVSGLRSQLGASNLLLTRLAQRHFRSAISTALCLEYSEVLHRPGLLPSYSPQEIDIFWIPSAHWPRRHPFIFVGVHSYLIRKMISC